MPKFHRPSRNRLTQLRLANKEPAVAAQPLAPEQTRIFAISLGQGRFQETAISQPDDLRQLIGKTPLLWVRVIGIGDSASIRKIGEIFRLHELAIEDVMNVQQRSKVEPYENYVFIVVRTVALTKGTLFSQQLSLFLGKNLLITFEECGDVPDCLDTVLERLRKDSGVRLRCDQADYLLYTIVDSAVDGFFPVVETIGDDLEALEDEIIEKPSRLTPARIHQLKREVVDLRRAIWPMRDAVSALTKEETSQLISPSTRIYIRDCYDHAVRIMDLVETQREMCSDLMDLYLSSVSNKMNEIIKVLTIVTLIFMPPTLVAGIYGMNLKIPETEWRYGYAWALILMVVSAAIVWVWAHRAGWLNDESSVR
jgi:magnesium transporter